MRARALSAVVMCLVVVLAGCTGLGGLGGGPGENNEAAASTPSDGDGDGGDSANGGGGDGDSSSGADGGSGGDESGVDGTSGGSSSDSSSSGDGSDGSDSSSSGGASSASLDAEEEWFNLSTPGRYVFEIESAEEGTGTMSFETTEVSGGQATVKVTYNLGEESFESTVTGPVGEVEGQIVTSPAYGYLIAMQLGGIGAGALSGGEELEVGNKFSQQSAEGSMLIEVVGTDTYADVNCYVIETRINGTLTQEICTQQAYSSAPYVAIYDENGDLSERVELVEFERK